MQSNYVVGSREREEIDRKLYEAKNRLITEQEKLITGVEAAEKRYSDALDGRTQAIFRSLGVFDEWKKKEDARADVAIAAEERVYNARERLKSVRESDDENTEKKLREIEKATRELAQAEEEHAKARELAAKSQAQIIADNLRSQNEGIQDYLKNLDILAERGISKEILDELKGMGKDAAGHIADMAGATDKELEEIVVLWEEKHALARRMATEELQGMREDVDEEIRGLYRDLEKLVDEESYPIGENMIQGMIDGLNDKSSELYDTMTRIANEVAARARAALDIQSPSKVMRALGRFTAQGFNIGLEEVAPLIERTAEKLGLAAIPGIGKNNRLLLESKRAALADAGTGDITINIYGPKLDSDRGIRQTAEELGFYMKQYLAARGG